MARVRLGLIILSLVLSSTSGYQTFMRQIFGSALMGDLLSTLPSRFQCVGTGKNFSSFLLFSRVHPDQHRSLFPGDHELLYKSDFNPSIPTKVIIHGFVDNLHISDWMQKMKTALLNDGEYNVIIVDWGCGNEFPYFQAVQNSKIVAGHLKNLILFLKDTSGADPANFHLIGHSLGSHIAALVGHGLPHLGRISALDPAGPRFYDAALEDRLDATDAKFVDVIHTDGGHGLLEGLGFHANMGHVDFYPNGGRNQPGCHSSPFTILSRIGLHRAARYYITCDHFRSIEYYIDSIRASTKAKTAGEQVCEPIGVSCGDWETFEQGRCADCDDSTNCAPMGYRSNLYVAKNLDERKREFYVKTAEGEPFCMFQYQVIIETGCHGNYCPEARDPTKPGLDLGIFQLELKKQNGKLSRLALEEKHEQKLRPRAQYVYLATSRFPIGEVNSARVSWGTGASADTAEARHSGLSLKKIQIVPIIVADLNFLSQAQPIVLCGSEDKPLSENPYVELSIDEC